MYNIGKAILFYVAVFLTLGGCNRGEDELNTTKDIYQSYKEKGIGGVFSVPPGLASVFLDEDLAGNAELKDILADVDQLTFLIIPNRDEIKESIYYSELDRKLDKIKFQNLAMINSGNEIVKVKVLYDKNDRIKEIVILVSNYETLFSVSFLGNIELEKVANLTKPENLEAVKHLNRFR